MVTRIDTPCGSRKSIRPRFLLDRLAQRPRQGEYIFQVRTGQPWYPAKAHNLFARVRSRARLDDVHLHDLRRTVLVYLVMNGENLEKVRQVANHTTLKTTSVYLAGLTSEITREPLERLASNWQAPTMGLAKAAQAG